MSDLVTQRNEYGDTLHGGAVRQPVTVVRPKGSDPSISANWYSVAPGQGVSLHKHTTKNEIWFVVSGEGAVRVGEDRIKVGPGMSIYTPLGTPHALRNSGSEPLIFVGIANPPSRVDPNTGAIFGTIEIEDSETAV